MLNEEKKKKKKPSLEFQTVHHNDQRHHASSNLRNSIGHEPQNSYLTYHIQKFMPGLNLVRTQNIYRYPTVHF